jgi:hypothetical protein
MRLWGLPRPHPCDISAMRESEKYMNQKNELLENMKKREKKGRTEDVR